MSRIRLPFQRLGPQQVEAGRVFQAEDELAVGELIDAGELHFDDRPQQGREGRAEVAAKAFVQRLQGPHLLLADALGPLEVVGRDLLARPRRRPRRRRRRRSRPASAAGRLRLHRAEQALDFRLTENFVGHDVLGQLVSRQSVSCGIHAN